MDAVIEKSRRGKSTAGIAGREKMKLPGKSLISSSRRGPPSPGPAITWEFLIHLNPLTDSLRDALFRGPSALSAGSFRGAVWAERGRREPEFLAAEERTDLAVNLLVHEKLRVIAVDERERPLPGIIEAVRRGGRARDHSGADLLPVLSNSLRNRRFRGGWSSILDGCLFY